MVTVIVYCSIGVQARQTQPWVHARRELFTHLILDGWGGRNMGYAAFTPKAAGRRVSVRSQRIDVFQALVAWNASIR